MDLAAFRRAAWLMGAFGLLAAAGCSSVGASAVRTGPLRLPPHVGAVALYAAGEPVEGADLGVVEVHAAQSEATIDTLVPLFVQKAAQIGGNAAVIEAVHATFDIVTHPQIETYTYACGRNATCTGTRTYAVNDEVMIVTLRGHAVRTGAIPGEAPPIAPPGAPPSTRPSP